MRRCVVTLLSISLLAACASRPPAPVIDRQSPTAKPAAPDARPDERVETYTVKRGDTLYSVALDNGLDWREVASLNGLTDPGRLQVGQVLRLRPPASEASGVQVAPVAGTGPIQARPLGGGEAAASAAVAATAAGGLLRTEPKGVKLPYSDENLAALQRATPPPALKPDAPPPAKPEAPPAARPPEAAPPPAENAEDRVDWAWPASGKVIAVFSESGTKGLDIAGRVGEPVYASAAGKVVYSGTGLRGYGKLIIIKHNEKYLSAYAHNSNILVKEGQSVTRGQKIAEIGATDADQPKLHFEIRRFGKPVDPAQFLPQK